MRVCVKARVLLRETLTLRDDDGRTPNCVAVLERLRMRLAETLDEGRTDRDAVKLNLKELLLDGLASFDGDTVIDLDLVLEIVMDFDID